MGVAALVLGIISIVVDVVTVSHVLHVLHLLQAHSNICFLKGYMEKDGTLSEYSGISYPILWIYDHTWSDYGKSFCPVSAQKI